MTFTGVITKVESNGVLVTVSYTLLDAKGNGGVGSTVFTMDIFNQTNGWFKPGQSFTKDLVVTASGKTLTSTFSFK